MGFCDAGASFFRLSDPCRPPRGCQLNILVSENKFIVIHDTKCAYFQLVLAVKYKWIMMVRLRDIVRQVRVMIDNPG